MWKVGRGDRFKFWEDEWIQGEASLITKYPRLFVVSQQQNQTIQQLGDFKDNEWEWNLSWRRPLFDNEITMASNFLRDIERNTIQRNIRDEWEWKADQSGQYTVQSAYKLMTREAIEGERDPGFEELWNLTVPIKVAVFALRLLGDKLPTKVNLYKRQVEVADRRCPFCGNMEEEAGHLFFTTTKSFPIWWESLSWLNISAALPIDPRQHFLHHGSILAGGTRTNRWKC